MNKKYNDIRVGVIGVGSMGQNHARVYSEICNLVGVSDVNENQVNNVAKRFGIKSFTDYKELLKEVDAVSIAVPTFMHMEISTFASSMGKHILVEKPLAHSSVDALRIIKSASENGVVLSVGHVERHNGVVELLLDNIEQGNWGDILTLTANRFSSYPQRITDVGVLFDLTIHDVDIIVSLVNSPVKYVFAAGGRFRNDGHEDQVCLTIGFQNGVVGICQTNWLTPMKVRELNITTTNSYVQSDYLNRKINVLKSDFGNVDNKDLSQIPITTINEQLTPNNTEPLKNELLDFLEAIQNNGTPLVTGKAGLEAVKIVEAGILSIDKNQIIKF